MVDLYTLKIPIEYRNLVFTERNIMKLGIHDSLINDSLRIKFYELVKCNPELAFKRIKSLTNKRRLRTDNIEEMHYLTQLYIDAFMAIGKWENSHYINQLNKIADFLETRMEG